MDLGQIIIAIAAPAFGFLGILCQCYFSNRSKNDKKEQTKQLSAAIAENTALAKANRELIEKNTAMVKELKDKLSANDVATVAVVRQNIRRMYYELLPHKQISVADYRALNEMYNAYKSVTLPDGHHPNSWCDALYEEMNGWERVEMYPSNIAHLNKPLKERK